MNAIDILVRFIQRIDSDHALPAKDYEEAMSKLKAMMIDSRLVVECLKRKLKTCDREERKVAKFAIGVIEGCLEKNDEWIRWYRSELLKYFREEEPGKLTAKIIKRSRKHLK